MKKSKLQQLFGFFLVLFAFTEFANAQATFSNGPLYIRTDNYGAVRVFTLDGLDTVQHINRISAMAAGNEGEVMDYWNDVDTEVETQIVPNSSIADYEVYGVYNNDYSGNPPSFTFTQYVYGWNDTKYILVKCNVKNNERTLTPMKFGLDIVQYMDYTWEDDNIFYDTTNGMLTQFDIHYVGIKLLSDETTSAQSFMWFDGYDTDSLYWTNMAEGTFDIDTLVTNADGGVSILAGTQQNLSAYASKDVYFAVAVGVDETDLTDNMTLAVEKYNQITSIQSDINIIPKEFVLSQNYPNPFNPTTKITFGLPQQSEISLSVYNTIGEKVAELVNGELSAGTHTFNFDASNLSSGIYFYRLETSENVITKKMMFIK